MLRRPPLLATALAVLGVCCLCALGTWQLQRLEWKERLMADLEAAYEGAPAASLNMKSLEDREFAYGRITGRVLADQAFFLGFKVQGEKPGHDLIIPVQ